MPNPKIPGGESGNGSIATDRQVSAATWPCRFTNAAGQSLQKQSKLYFKLVLISLAEARSCEEALRRVYFDDVAALPPKKKLKDSAQVVQTHGKQPRVVSYLCLCCARMLT